jgi:hypothetical protein
MKNPTELAYPEKFPDDLKLLLKEQKVPANDPLVVLLAWHWMRLNEGRDVLRETTTQLKAALDERQEAMQDKAFKIGALLEERFKRLDEWSKTLQTIFENVDGLSRVLSEKPLGISQQIASELAHPISQSVDLVKQLSVDIGGLLADVDASRKRLVWSHIVTAYISGFATGTLLISWIYSHIFLH